MPTTTHGISVSISHSWQLAVALAGTGDWGSIGVDIELLDGDVLAEMNEWVREELAKFGELAHRWWDPESDFKPLHQINPLRLDWIDQFAAIRGKSVVDVGCGGGILADSMARLRLMFSFFSFVFCHGPPWSRARMRQKQCTGILSPLRLPQ